MTLELNGLRPKPPNQNLGSVGDFSVYFNLNHSPCLWDVFSIHSLRDPWLSHLIRGHVAFRNPSGYLQNLWDRFYTLEQSQRQVRIGNIKLRLFEINRPGHYQVLSVISIRLQVHTPNRSTAAIKSSKRWTAIRKSRAKFSSPCAKTYVHSLTNTHPSSRITRARILDKTSRNSPADYRAIFNPGLGAARTRVKISRPLEIRRRLQSSLVAFHREIRPLRQPIQTCIQINNLIHSRGCYQGISTWLFPIFCPAHCSHYAHSPVPYRGVLQRRHWLLAYLYSFAAIVTVVCTIPGVSSMAICPASHMQLITASMADMPLQLRTGEYVIRDMIIQLSTVNLPSR